MREIQIRDRIAQIILYGKVYRVKNSGILGQGDRDNCHSMLHKGLVLEKHLEGRMV